MPIAFEQSETRLNLMRAFAGESQARNRYTFAAAVARKSQVPALERVFLFTADQERAHAKVYYDLLTPVGGQNLKVDGTYPVNLSSELAVLLRDAQHNELEEWGSVYPTFAQVARQEEFLEIAQAFGGIAQVERSHGERFGKLADLLESGTLFVSSAETQWMCLNCGHQVAGRAAPAMCPICKHPQGYFIRWELAPFSA